MQRGTELQSLMSWAMSNSEAALLVVGVAGSGKSLLLRNAAQSLGESAVLVRANGSESAWPFSGISSVLTSFDDPVLASLAESANHVEPEERRSFALSVAAALRAVSGDGFWLLLDDADLFDAQSRSIIGFVARRLRGSGSKVVLAVRAAPTSGDFDGLERLELSNLDREAMARIVRKRTNLAVKGAVVDAVLDSSDGVPGLAVEIMRTLGSGHLVGTDALPLPFRPGPAALALGTKAMENLSPDSIALIEALSTVFKMPMEDAVTVAAAEPGAVAELVGAGIVHRRGAWLAIESQAIRSSVYKTMSASRRQDLHSQFAGGHLPDSPLRCWHHSFVDASPAAAVALRTEALELVRKGHESLAIEFVELSLTISLPVDADCALLLAVADGFFHRGNFAFAERYVDFVDAAATTAANRINIAGLRVKIEYLTNQRLLTALVTHVLDRFSDDAPDEAAMLLSVLAMYRAELWEFDAADDLLTRADELRPRISGGSQMLRASARLLVDSMNGRETAPLFSSSRVPTDVGSGPIATTVLMTRARALTYAERYEDARGLFEMILSSEARVEPLWAMTTRVYSIDNDLISGDFHGAMTSVEALLAGSTLPRTHLPFRAFLEFWYKSEKGDTAAATEALERVYKLNHGRGNASVSARADAYQGARSIHEGRLDSAVRLLMRSRVVSASVDNPLLYRSDADLIEALVRSEDHVTAARVFENFERRATKAPSRWALLATVRSRALLADGMEAIDQFESLIAMHTADDSDYEHARTLTAYAGHLAAENLTPESLRYRREASALYARMGLPQWSNALEQADNVPTSQNRDTPMLSPAEREVADLIISGMRNREIAVQLFVSVRAVESRLTALYRKLGVRSRSEMAMKLSRL